MLATLIPLFDNEMNVCAYSVFAQKRNILAQPSYAGTGRLDGAGAITGMEIVENLGLETLAGDKLVFIEVNGYSVFSDIEKMCTAPHDRVVLLIDHSVKPTEMYLSRLNELKEAGFKLAIRRLHEDEFTDFGPVLSMMSYIFLNYKKLSNFRLIRNGFNAMYPEMELCAVDVNTREEYEEIKDTGDYCLYEGTFFRMPIRKKDKKVAPLKMTYLRLLNVVEETDFELTDAADVIGHDTALVISLLKIVNGLTVNAGVSSVRHATAMLGQRELKKWINAAITKELCADKPSEIMRLSMVRAKFCENLSPIFGMRNYSAELFLTGLFSVLDVILGTSMERSLEMMNVSSLIKDALLTDSGPLAVVLDFVRIYEDASWQEVSRRMLLKKFDSDEVYDAYVGALRWYKELITEEGSAKDPLVKGKKKSSK